MKSPNTLLTSATALLAAGTLSSCDTGKSVESSSPPECSTRRVATAFYDKTPHATANRRTWNRGARILLKLPPTLTPDATATIGYETNSPNPLAEQTEWHDSNRIALKPYETAEAKHKVAFAMKIGDRAVAFSIQVTDRSAGQPDLCTSIPETVFTPAGPANTLPFAQVAAGAIAPTWPQRQ